MIKTYVLNIQELEKTVISLNKKLKVLQDVTLSVNTNRRYIPNIKLPINSKRTSKNFDRLQLDGSKSGSIIMPRRSSAPFVRHRRNNSQTTVSDKLNILQNEDRYISIYYYFINIIVLLFICSYYTIIYNLLLLFFINFILLSIIIYLESTHPSLTHVLISPVYIYIYYK